MKLLLDSHVTKAAIAALKRRAPQLDAIHLADWRAGTLLNASDADILAACFTENRVWFTYDTRTVPDLLRQWAAAERPHAGVIFASSKTLPSNNPGALAIALLAVVEQQVGNADTRNLVRFVTLVP